ncbi:unnamed protein product [Ixodes persulcatus]
MANIKTEFYSAIARLQKQLESNSLSKDDKADAEKYIKETLNKFREKLSPREKKISVDDVKAIAKEVDNADQKKEELANKMNTPVKKEEIQDITNNLKDLKKEFDDLNTKVDNAVKARPSKADYEGLKNDLFNTQSTYLDTALKDLTAELDKDIEDAKAAKQDQISQDVSDKFKNDVKSKSDACIGEFGKVRSRGQGLSDKVKEVSDQIAPVQDLYNKFPDLQDKISVMLSKASNGQISEEDNDELSKVNNQFKALVKDVTNLLKITQDTAQQYPNLEELNTFTSSIVTDESIKEKFDNLIKKMNAPIVLFEKVEEASSEGEKEVKEQNDQNKKKAEETGSDTKNSESLLKQSIGNREEAVIHEAALKKDGDTESTDNAGSKSHTEEPSELAQELDHGAKPTDGDSM